MIQQLPDSLQCPLESASWHLTKAFRTVLMFSFFTERPLPPQLSKKKWRSSAFQNFLLFPQLLIHSRGQCLHNACAFSPSVSYIVALLQLRLMHCQNTDKTGYSVGFWQAQTDKAEVNCPTPAALCVWGRQQGLIKNAWSKWETCSC